MSNSITKKYYSAVGMCVCNADQYIQEMLCHNYLSGFDRIIVCLDRCTDDTYNAIERLAPEVREVVDVINNYGYHPGIGYQQRAYMKMYEFYKGRVEWLAFFDDDEYLYDSHMRPVNDMLRAVDRPGVDQVVVPWLVYGHNNQIMTAPRTETRLKWFTKRKTSDGWSTVKPIVRVDQIKVDGRTDGGSRPCETVKWYYSHAAEVYGKTVNFAGQEVALGGAFDRMALQEAFIDNNNVALCHYLYGSMEDFAKRHKKWKVERDIIEEGARLQGRETVKYGWKADEWIVSDDERYIVDERMIPYAEQLAELLSKCK